jgi:hypothetical protein
MRTTLVERRMSLAQNPANADINGISNVVRQGLHLQRLSGTLSAVEHLKAHSVPGSVIGRVLSGGAKRIDDLLGVH